MRSFYLIVSLLVLNFSFPIPGQGLAYAENESLSTVFRLVNPAVVEVAGLQDRQEKTGSSPENVLGSGVVISKEGAVLTSAHVVETADRITVRFLDGAIVQAEIVSMAGQADLALLQLKSVPRDLSIAELGNSDSAEVGEKIFVIILEIQGSPVLPTVKNFCALNDMVGGFSSESRFEMLILRNGRKVLLSNGQASE